MANWFENVTKTLADNTLTRRQAIQRISGTAAAIALASWFPEQAFASTERKHYCKQPGSCNGITLNCEVKFNKYNNCYCFQKMGTNYKGVCGCNSYCASVPLCAANTQCPSGYACITNTGCACSGGVCVPRCTKTCQLGSNNAGRTTASAI